MFLVDQVCSNCVYFTENISWFLDFHLQPLEQRVRCFINDTNDLLKQLCDIPPFQIIFYLHSVDIVGLNPNIPHEDGLTALTITLDKRKDGAEKVKHICHTKTKVYENFVKTGRSDMTKRSLLELLV